MLCNCVHGGEYNNCVLKLYIGDACVYSISLQCVGNVCMSVFMYMHDCVCVCVRERERERERLCVFIVPSIIPIGRKVGDVP